MGNAPSDKKPRVNPNSTARYKAAMPNSTNNNLQVNNTGDNNQEAPAEESDESDSSSENYSFGNSQFIARSDPDANYSLIDMPNEILCLLIANLEAKNDIRSLMFTSKIFVELVYYSWSRLSMQYDNKLTYHQFLLLPAERLNYLIELDISYCSKMTNALFNQILEKTPNLQVLKMKRCKRLTRPSFSKLAQSFTRLTSLDARYCNAEEIHYADFPYNPNLKELGICPSVLGKFDLDPLAITHLNLKSEAIRNYDRLSIQMEDLYEFANLVTFKGRIKTTGDHNGRFWRQQDFEEPTSVSNYFDFSAFKELENLSLTNEVGSFKFANPQKIKRLSFMPGFFDGTAFADMGNLISLKMKPRANRNEGGLTNFTLAHLPKLEVLQCEILVTKAELAERSTLTKLDVPFQSKEFAIAAISALPNLTSFAYRGMIDKDLFQALRSLKKLEHLQFSSIYQGVKKLNWKRLKTLKSIRITDCSYDGSANLLQQLKQIPKLEKLHLRSTDGSRLILSNPDHMSQFCKYFEGFPSLKVLVMRDNIFYYNEREEALMKIKGLTYVDCQRLQ